MLQSCRAAELWGLSHLRRSDKGQSIIFLWVSNTSKRSWNHFKPCPLPHKHQKYAFCLTVKWLEQLKESPALTLQSEIHERTSGWKPLWCDSTHRRRDAPKTSTEPSPCRWFVGRADKRPMMHYYLWPPRRLHRDAELQHTSTSRLQKHTR